MCHRWKLKNWKSNKFFVALVEESVIKYVLHGVLVVVMARSCCDLCHSSESRDFWMSSPWFLFLVELWQLAAFESIITLKLLKVSCTDSCPFYWICFSGLLLSSLSQLKLCSLIIFIIIIQFIQFVTLFA